MATSRPLTAATCLLITILVLESVVLVACALVNRPSVQKHKHPHSRHHDSLIHTDKKKNPESNFWIAIEQNNTLDSDRIPAIPQLDKETGTLPPGAYRNRSGDSDDVVAKCLIAVGIQPPLSNANRNDNGDMWMEGVQNCQKLIDAGFNTFRVNNCYKYDKGTSNISKRIEGKKNKRRRSPSSIAIERMKQHTMQIETRHNTEKHFYHVLQQGTPPSVLRTCHFSVNVDIPSILSQDIIGIDKDTSHTPYGNGWMVRESISNALLRTKRECLDSVVLEYCKSSPYHLDVLDTLFELQCGGLIQSISTRNFPTSMLQTALDCGFNIDSNEMAGNLLNTNNLHSDDGLSEKTRLISSPLGSGLLTNQFSLNKNWAHLSSSTKKQFNFLFDTCCKMHSGSELDNLHKWERYRTIIDTLEDMSFRYQVSVESIAMRWLLQLYDSDSISVSTRMGMDCAEKQGGAPYGRHRDLREVFTFSLEDDDMERLRQVSGLASDTSQSKSLNDHQIDFTNKALWM